MPQPISRATSVLLLSMAFGSAAFAEPSRMQCEIGSVRLTFNDLLAIDRPLAQGQGRGHLTVLCAGFCPKGCEVRIQVAEEFSSTHLLAPRSFKAPPLKLTLYSDEEFRKPLNSYFGSPGALSTSLHFSASKEESIQVDIPFFAQLSFPSTPAAGTYQKASSFKILYSIEESHQMPFGFTPTAQ